MVYERVMMWVPSLVLKTVTMKVMELMVELMVVGFQVVGEWEKAHINHRMVYKVD